MNSNPTLSRGVILDRKRVTRATTPPSGRIVQPGSSTILPVSPEEEALEPASKAFTSLLVGGAFAVSALLAYPAVTSIFQDPSDASGGSLIAYNDLQMRMLRSDEDVLPGTLPELFSPEEVSQGDAGFTEDDFSPQAEIRVRQVGRVLQPTSSRRASAPLGEGERAPENDGYLYSPDVVRQVLKVIRRHGKKGVDQAELASAIVSESKRQNYDPLFVAAVIKSESAFNTFATSHVGAKGLMQIMPKTGEYIESFKELEGIPRGGLTQPGYNLKLGIAYLKYLERMFKGNKVLTLIAYNWGPGHVVKTVRGEKSGVPRSVMNYALKILYDHSRWHEEIEKNAYS